MIVFILSPISDIIRVQYFSYEANVFFDLLIGILSKGISIILNTFRIMKLMLIILFRSPLTSLRILPISTNTLSILFFDENDISILYFS